MSEQRQPAATVLAYDNPHVFFEGSYRFRSLNAVAGIVALAGFGVMALFVARIGGAPRWFDLMFGIASVGCFFGATYFAVGLIAGREVKVRVTDDGIESGHRLYEWNRISKVYGTKFTNGILLCCMLGRGGFRTGKRFATLPALTSSDYSALVEALVPYLREHCPHVEVDPEPREESSS